MIESKLKAKNCNRGQLNLRHMKAEQTEHKAF